MRLDFPGVGGSGEIWMDVVKAICGDTAGKSMLDLMAHRAPYTPLLGFKTPVYVDIQERDFDFPKEKKSFVKWDVRKIMDCRLVVNNAPFDVAICSDGIEHLTKIEGMRLLCDMLFLSNKSIFFTPIGWVDCGGDSEPDRHKSAWQPDDFVEYATIVFPNFHPELNCGAFFAFRCADLKQEFNRIKKELKTKSWTKLNLLKQP
jgi:hypothetical protein